MNGWNQCFTGKCLTARQKKKEALICIICGFLWYKYSYLAFFNLSDTLNTQEGMLAVTLREPVWADTSTRLAGTELGSVSMWCEVPLFLMPTLYIPVKIKKDWFERSIENQWVVGSKQTHHLPLEKKNKKEHGLLLVNTNFFGWIGHSCRTLRKVWITVIQGPAHDGSRLIFPD